ncbi:MAG: DUF72 domain-containing protein [Thermoleophilia bacterium]|nr:DUF72 domain-containing protein [Thermoleophilia bacterium]
MRVGTCSWTDPTMVRAWYPVGVKSAADRLRYYAAHFDTVEVDSTFYGLPNRYTAQLWADRTPPGFVFHVKAFGMLTRHGVRPEQLPAALRDAYELELDRQGRIVHPPEELREEVFRLFGAALEPLRAVNKLGVILLQFPPYFVANESNQTYLAQAVELLAPDPVAVEFRHISWVSAENLDKTLDLLRSLNAAFVCVDEPRISAPNILPPLTAVTSDIAYVRFHGRNAATWNIRGGSAAERFKYLYQEDELREWVEPVRSLSQEAATTYLMFNNCYADYAPRNAKQMLSLLDATPYSHTPIDLESETSREAEPRQQP